MRFICHSHLCHDGFKNALFRHRKKHRDWFATRILKNQVGWKFNAGGNWFVLSDVDAAPKRFVNRLGCIFSERAGGTLGRQKYKVLKAQ